MANKTIGGSDPKLTVVTSAAADDLLAIWRTANADTRSITKTNFMGGVLTGGGTIATGGFTLTVGATSAINGSLVGNISGGGTLALGGYTLTVPATGTAALKEGFSGARVYNSANISIPNNSSTALTFNSERYDNANYHSTSSNTSRLTAPSDGLYIISAHVYFQANATGFRQLSININGTAVALEVRTAVTVASTATIMTITTQTRMTAGQYAEVAVQQTSGGDLNVIASSSFSPEFMIARVGD